MKLKLDENGNVVVQDGHPVYVYDDGKESPFDAAGANNRIKELNGEAMRNRQGREELQNKLKGFEGIENPEEALKALERVKSLNAGELKTADQVEEIKRQAQKAAEEQVTASVRSSNERAAKLEADLKAATGSLDNEVLKNAFSNSKFVREKLSWPASAVQKVLGERFKREGDKIVSYDSKGEKRYSRKNAGDLADFDEALEMAVDEYEHRDVMLKGTGSSGAGGRQGTGAPGGGKSMTRQEFDRMPPHKQGEVVRGGTQIVD